MKKRYEKLILADEKVSEELKTSEGRENYFQTLLKQSKNYDLYDLLLESLTVQGEIIELGVWRGITTRRIGAVMKRSGVDKKIYACDSFEGFGSETITKEDTSLFRSISRLKKKFTAAGDVPAVLEQFFDHYQITGFCVKGFFSKSLKAIEDEKFCFAHVDCDAYSSHVDCLNFIYPRLSSGGCIVFDDYNEKKWPGASKAIDEFFEDKPESIKLSDKKENSAWHVIKL